jgi:hypothetical protein
MVTMKRFSDSNDDRRNPLEYGVLEGLEGLCDLVGLRSYREEVRGTDLGSIPTLTNRWDQ